MKKWIKITLIAAAVLAVLIVIAAIAVSPVAKNYIEKHDRELIGRSIRMERLRMNIFTGRLRIEGLRIGGSEDSTTFSDWTASRCACGYGRCWGTACS